MNNLNECAGGEARGARGLGPLSIDGIAIVIVIAFLGFEVWQLIRLLWA
jgi:hypothetical protein